ncbi:MAG: DUF2188 domain-containing protein [Actinobacteria bacterium]|nr:DUF2188 domain-containing protein [Actinomycetota bacterium]
MHVYDLAPGAHGWEVRRRGHRFAAAVRATRDSALNKAQAIAKVNRPSRVIVFDPDGSVETEFVYDQL